MEIQKQKIEYHKTPHGTYRLWIPRSDMPTDTTKRTLLFVILDTLCAWGCADKVEADHMSWEFQDGIGALALVNVLAKNSVGTQEQRAEVFGPYLT